MSVAIEFMPHVADLRAYAGFFYASDPESKDADILTKSKFLNSSRDYL